MKVLVNASSNQLPSRLSCLCIDRNSLSTATEERMYQLFAANYDFVSRGRFESDLNQKDFVLLLHGPDGQIQGFSSVALNPRGISAESFNIIYSGDTVVAPAYWGTQELVKGFSELAFSLLADSPGKRLFWLLLSKGHRTFMYLPLFFRSFYPCPQVVNREYAQIADKCASQLFGHNWVRSEGVIRFATRLGQLKPDLAEATWRRAHNPYVKFFLEKNPGFFAGDELVCCTEINLRNLSPRGTRLVGD